ncbi:MAG: hypothetical protein FJ357_05440 [Thaumarchaeota archaeon]|nr:hypothetical protein [Nitrososphaerota archaeon]
MHGDKLWTITVVAALSSLLILAYFLLSPMLSKESTAQKIESGLGESIAKFDSIREESESSELSPAT